MTTETESKPSETPSPTVTNMNGPTGGSETGTGGITIAGIHPSEIERMTSNERATWLWSLSDKELCRLVEVPGALSIRSWIVWHHIATHLVTRLAYPRMRKPVQGIEAERAKLAESFRVLDEEVT